MRHRPRPRPNVLLVPLLLGLSGVQCIPDLISGPKGGNSSNGLAVRLEFTVQPDTVAAGAAIDVEVAGVDASGNVAEGFHGSIQIGQACPPGCVTLGGSTLRTAQNGRARFNLSIYQADVNYALTAVSQLPGNQNQSSVSSQPFVVLPAAATALSFVNQPTSGAAGSVLQTFTVQALDQYQNRATQYTGTVTLALAPGSGGTTLNGTTSAAAVNGVATFSDLTIPTAANYSLIASANGLTSANSTGFNIFVGPPAKLAFVTQPLSATGGTAIAPAVTVAVQDAAGNTVVSPGATVTIAMGANPGGGTLSGTLGAFTASGIATFANLSINTAASGYTLTASASGLTSATSAPFDVAVGAPNRLAFITQPTASVAGTAITPGPQVAVRDAGGNLVTTATNTVALAFGANPGAGTLGGTTSVAAVGGVATFSNLTVSAVASNYTLAATSTGLTGSTSTSFNVTVGPPSRLSFATEPSNTSVGTPFASTVRVSIVDAAGNVVPAATDSITLSIGSNPGSATLAGTTRVAAVAGVASFPGISLDAAGIGYRLSATSGTLTSATSAGFNVVGPPAELAFSAQPTNGIARGTLAPAITVTVRDAAGQTVTSAGTAITVGIGNNPGGAILGGTVTRNASGGIATFANLTLSAAGSGYTLVASAAGLTGATSATFDIAAFGAASKLAFVTQPTNVNAGSAITPAVEVQVQDALGNAVTNATNSIAIALGANPGAATLSGTLTQPASNGIAVFADLSLNAAANGYTITATGSGLTSATSNGFRVVNPNAAIKLGFLQQPGNASAGSSISPAITVAVQDNSGATVTDDTTVVTLSVASGPGPLRGTLQATAAGGIATFSNVSDTVAGSYTLRAAAAGLTAAISASFTVSPGIPDKLEFGVQPSTGIVGEALPPFTVEIHDQFGNRVPAAANAVQIQLLTCCSAANIPPLYGSGPPVGGTSSVNAQGGVATFSSLRPRSYYWYWACHGCNFNGTGQLLGASSTGLTGAQSSLFTINAGSPVALGIAAVPGQVTARQPFTVSVAPIDSLGNPAALGTESVTLSIATGPANANLTGTTSGVAQPVTVNGHASLSVGLDSLGTYTLMGSSQGLGTVTTTTFDVVAAAAAQLGYVVPPSNAAVGAPIAPAVRICVLDPYLNEVRSATGSIAVSLGANPGGATLGGTLTRTLASGCASFNDLSVSAAASGYTLSATASGVSGVSGSYVSPAFTVTP